MKRKFRVIKARKGFGGGADASKSDFGTGPSSKGDARSEYLSSGQYTGGPKGTKDGGNKTPPSVTLNKGPFQVPSPFNYTITGQVVNRFSKAAFDAKNLKDAKKNDVLGGEMLTTGPTGPKGPKDTGGNKQFNKVNQPVQAISATKPVDQTLVSPKDNFFNFVAYKVGGLSGGVSYGPPPKRGPNSQVPPIKMKRGGYKK